MGWVCFKMYPIYIIYITNYVYRTDHDDLTHHTFNECNKLSDLPDKPIVHNILYVYCKHNT